MHDGIITVRKKSRTENQMKNSSMIGELHHLFVDIYSIVVEFPLPAFVSDCVTYDCKYHARLESFEHIYQFWLIKYNKELPLQDRHLFDNWVFILNNFTEDQIVLVNLFLSHFLVQFLVLLEKLPQFQSLSLRINYTRFIIKIYLILFIIKQNPRVQGEPTIEFNKNGRSSIKLKLLIQCSQQIQFKVGIYSHNIIILSVSMLDKKEYTPTKSSKLFTNITNTQLSTNKPTLQYSQRPAPQSSELPIIKEYEALKLQVKQMEFQNRQLSNQAQKLRYQKNIQQNKYLQKVSYEEDVISQFQKEKNYQIELLKIKNDEDINKTRREYDYKLDQLHRELRGKDYHNRELNQKNSYIELKINQLRKGVECLEIELVKSKQNNTNLSNLLGNEQSTHQKLLSITEQLQRQKCQMQAEIHVLLDIEAQKSRTINTLQIQLRNSEATERSLHQKINNLTQNFASLEQHITVMKQRLISTDMRNEQLEKQLEGAEFHLAEKDNNVVIQKELEVKLRKQLEVQQQREMRRQRQLDQLIMQNQRLDGEMKKNKQQLQDLCINQGIQV